jgi:transposase
MDSREMMMAADELFGDLPAQSAPQAEAAALGAPRLREPQRDQIALRAVDIESLIGEDHPVRLIWSYVEELDLSELENRIKARDDRPGHPATSPRLLLALWLYATSEGVGSARALERLCESHDAYRWHLALAETVVEDLKREVDARSDASNQRARAAKERAARERSARVKAAQTALAEIKQQRKAREEKRGNGKKPKEPRASTTDADARVMKMADGGFRPAYNVQVTSAAGQQIVVDTKICNTGSDRGLMRPMLERQRTRPGGLPKDHLVDGGFGSAEDIEWAHAEGVEILCPPTQSKHGTDPYLPRRGDGPGVLAWRARMASEAGKVRYKPRSICECIHARWRNWDLRQLTVRGIEKVRAVVLWFALTNNILQGNRLHRA